MHTRCGWSKSWRNNGQIYLSEVTNQGGAESANTPILRFAAEPATGWGVLTVLDPLVAGNCGEIPSMIVREGANTTGAALLECGHQ